MPKFAANLSMMFTEWEFLDRFRAAADAGFSAVEYLFPYAFDPEAIGKRLQANGLKQALYNLPPGNWDAGERGLAALPDRFADFRQSVESALRYVPVTGVKRLHVMSGLAPCHSPAHMESYRRALQYVCEAVSAHGINVLIEPINGRDMPGYFLNDFAAAATLIEEMRLPNLRLQYDIYHRQILHGDVLKSIEALMPVIDHVQIASVPRRNEPGTGELNDSLIFGVLDASGYQGYVGCEYRPAAGTVQGLEWFERYKGA